MKLLLVGWVGWVGGGRSGRRRRRRKVGGWTESRRANGYLTRVMIVGREIGFCNFVPSIDFSRFLSFFPQWQRLGRWDGKDCVVPGTVHRWRRHPLTGRLALLFWRENHGGLFLPIIIIAIMLRPRDGSYQEWNGIHATFLYHCERQGLEILSHLFPIVCVCESFHCWVRRELPESNCYFHGSYKWKTQLVNNSPINAWLIADCWSANRFWLLGMESRDS